MKRLHKIIFVSFFLLISSGFSVPAQSTEMKANYFPRCYVGNDQHECGDEETRIDRAELYWANPGALGTGPFGNKFCIYRHKTTPQTPPMPQTYRVLGDFNRDGDANDVGEQSGYFYSYSALDFDPAGDVVAYAYDATYVDAENDYSYLSGSFFNNAIPPQQIGNTGLLEYFGVRSLNCDQVANASLPVTAATTDLARAVPNISITEARSQETAQGIQINLTLTKPTNYSQVVIWAMGHEQPVINMNSPPFSLSVPATTGTHTVTFTIGSDPGEMNLPLVAGQKCAFDGLTDGTNYQFGVSGFLAGGNLITPPSTTYTSPTAKSSILISDPMTVCVRALLAIPEPTPQAPQMLPLEVEDDVNVRLSWSNAEPYHHLIVKKDGETFYNDLPGNQEQVTFDNLPFGQGATFSLIAVGNNGLVSEPVSIELENPLVPQPPSEITLTPGIRQLSIAITATENAPHYVGHNQIQGYEIQSDNLLNPSFSRVDFAESSGSTVFTIPALEPGIYRVTVATIANSVLSAFTNAIEGEVQAQPIATLPVPEIEPKQVKTDLQHWYNVVFALSPDQRNGVYDRVELRDAAGNLVTTLRASEIPNENWQAEIPFTAVGTFSGWSSQGFRQQEFSETSSVEFSVELKAPDFWYWINDRTASGQLAGDRVGRHLHFKVLSNFPAGTSYGSNHQIVLEIKNHELTRQDILAHYQLPASERCHINPRAGLLDTRNCDRPEPHGNHVILPLNSGVPAADGYVYYTHSLPSDHSQAGEQTVLVRTEVLENGVVMARSATNTAKFSVGVRYGDVNNDDKIDVTDIQHFIKWWRQGGLTTSSFLPDCLETFNGDGDGYIPLPLNLNQPPPQPNGRNLKIDSRTQTCDTTDGVIGNDDPRKEHVEDVRRLFDGSGDLTVDSFSFTPTDRGKPMGYDSAPPVSGYACYYNRYANPAYPVFNEISRFYPGITGYCKYGPYQTPAKAWCQPGDTNDPTAGETCNAGETPPANTLDPSTTKAIFDYGINRAGENFALSGEDLGAMFQMPPPPVSGGSGSSGDPDQNLPRVTPLGPVLDL